MKQNHKSQITNYKLNKGSAWAGVIILIFFVISIGLVLTSDVTGTLVKAKRADQAVVAQTLAEAGVEKAVWKINQNSGYVGESNLSFPTGTLDIAIQNIDQNNKYVTATAYIPNKTAPKVTRRIGGKIYADINQTDVSFRYGVQVGSLGVNMSNNAKIIGNVYSDGTITGGNGSQITGDAYVSGIANKIYGVEVDGNSHAHTIQNTDANGNAYYFSAATLINSSVAGTKYPGSVDPALGGLPISQATIDQWETWAAAGSVYNGNYSITDGVNGTIGPIKINGNLTVTNGSTLTMTGPIWVTGNINFSNNATVKLAPSFGASSSMIIADSPTNKATYGKVVVSNNVTIQGSGNAASHIMIVSTNTGSTTSNPAINAGNNSSAVIYYAISGMVEVSNNAHLKSVSGLGLHLSNGAQVQYDSGLADANFSGGPGGSWKVKEWQILH